MIAQLSIKNISHAIAGKPLIDEFLSRFRKRQKGVTSFETHRMLIPCRPHKSIVRFFLSVLLPAEPSRLKLIKSSQLMARVLLLEPLSSNPEKRTHKNQREKINLISTVRD